MKGIDVSDIQGKIKWKRVKEAGIEFAMLRVGYGDRNIDSFFRKNASLCRKNNISVGAYWFSCAATEQDAISEARYCIRAIKHFRIEFPVCFYFDYAAVVHAEKQGIKINKETASRIAAAYLNEIEANGYYAMNYCNSYFYERIFSEDIHKQFDTWYSFFAEESNVTDVGIWQYDSREQVDGIEGDVNVNIALKDYRTVIGEKGLNRLRFKKNNNKRQE